MLGAGAVCGGVLLGPLVGLGAEAGGAGGGFPSALLLCGAGCEERGESGVGFPGVAVDLDRRPEGDGGDGGALEAHGGALVVVEGHDQGAAW